MRSIIFLLLIAGILGCNRIETEQENSTLRMFFRTLVSLECKDTTTNTLSLTFRYRELNPEKITMDFIVPDSIEDARFFNAYAERLSSFFFIWANEDTTQALDKILAESDCNIKSAEDQLIQLCEKHRSLKETFEFIHKSYFENESIEKTTITLDSLTKISLAYFGITGYTKGSGIVFNFSCGQNPFEFSSSNADAISIGEFCREAIKNKSMLDTFIQITEEVNKIYRMDKQRAENTEEIKKQYEPILHTMLRNNNALAESLIEYYKKRKEIEPFILQN